MTDMWRALVGYVVPYRHHATWHDGEVVHHVIWWQWRRRVLRVVMHEVTVT